MARLKIHYDGTVMPEGTEEKLRNGMKWKTSDRLISETNHKDQFVIDQIDHINKTFMATRVDAVPVRVDSDGEFWPVPV